MTSQLQIYYYLDEQSSTVFYSEGEISEPGNMLLLGSSNNPNKKMCAAVLLKQREITEGMRILPWISPENPQ